MQKSLKIYLEGASPYTVPIACGVFTIFAIAYMSTTFWPINHKTISSITGLAYLFPPIIASIGAAFAIQRNKRTKRVFWAAMFAGLLFELIGECIWVYYQLAKDMAEPPLASVTHLFYIGGYVCFFAALITAWKIAKERERISVANYVVTILMTGAAVLSIFFLQSTILFVPTVGTSATENFINFIYPNLDVVLVVGLGSLTIISNTSVRQKWLSYVVVGLLLFASADLVFNSFSILNMYDPGTLGSNIIDILWMSCYFLFFVGSLFAIQPEPKPLSNNVFA